MLLKKALTSTTKLRSYSTVPAAKGRGFYYQYGTPIVKCAVIASATTMGFQLLWQHLEYQEYRDEADAYVTKLENRLKALEAQQQH